MNSKKSIATSVTVGLKDEGIYIGHDMWRHKKCKPGSNKWLKSKIGQENSLITPHDTQT